MTKLIPKRFGQSMTEHMIEIEWRAKEGWGDTVLKPYQNISIAPSAQVFHYAQGAFEGVKAYSSEDGKVFVFRAKDHARRFQNSCRRLAIPELPTATFIGALKKLVTADIISVPATEEGSLYLRPFVIATEPSLGFFGRSRNFKFIVIACSSGSYFSETTAINVKVESKYSRAARGGTGSVKAIGNYAGTILSHEVALQENFHQVLWLDAIENQYVEELSSSNIFFVYDDHIKTPALNDSILAGITRDSVMQLAYRDNVRVMECKISISEIITDASNGKLKEAFVTGTTAQITSIKNIVVGKEMIEFGKFDMATRFYRKLSDIHRLRKQAPNEWIEFI
ncbi:branched-chain amino acid aminotransferase [Agarilytica rhodophyticola]|uniref:branched-chain amino acid aminotransferase n=1 Tax=Agarilytica rhodophyticola TaxID=1737490 RepID=UPI000B34480A|nr:branched-chain amino acid aminotransferase [Agarilytica rhodophyticola]